MINSRLIARLGTAVIVFVAGCLAQHCLAQQWKTPKSGWLYVLDIGMAGTGGNIFLVDPSDGSIKGKLATGYHPNFGMCPNGLSLYVTDGSQAAGTLRIIDTQTGEVKTTVSIPDRATYTARPAEPGVGCSADGRWIYVQRMVTLRPGTDEHTILIIDAASGQLLSQSVDLPGCGIASFVPWPFGTWDTAIRCSVANSLWLVSLADAAAQPKVGYVSLTWAPRVTASEKFVADGQRVSIAVLTDSTKNVAFVLRGGGGLDKLDPVTLSISPNIADDWQRWQPPGHVAISALAGLEYAGFVPYAQWTSVSGLTSSISVRRTDDWTEVLNIQTSRPFWTLALSNDGRVLYAVNTVTKSITAYQTSTMSETNVLSGLGSTPVLVMVQP
jgi:hypothetical protein